MKERWFCLRKMRRLRGVVGVQRKKGAQRGDWSDRDQESKGGAQSAYFAASAHTAWASHNGAVLCVTYIPTTSLGGFTLRSCASNGTDLLICVRPGLPSSEAGGRGCLRSGPGNSFSDSPSPVSLPVSSHHNRARPGGDLLLNMPQEWRLGQPHKPSINHPNT